MKQFNEFIFYNTSNNLSWMLAGIILLIVTSWLYLKPINISNRILYFSFFIGFVCFGIGFSLIDPFLNIWDEQYHALVAKNLAENPLYPILVKESPIKLDYRIWAYNHIWLHKQPLFLWQMAASIKLFGANMFSVRFPSVLLHAMTALLILSISKRFISHSLALLACLLFGLSSYFNDYVSGAIGMDHNDVSFVFYITLSYWSYLKYRENNRSRKWQIIIGLAIGAAILTKWLVGLLLFSGWGIVLLIEDRKNIQEWKNIIFTFMIAIIVVLPWQIYCAIRFPIEYQHELTFNSLHFTETVESHSGDVLFYWNVMDDSYGGGNLIKWLIILGLILMIYHSIKQRNYWKLILPLAFIVTHVFFTLAATKLQGYTTIVAFSGFVMLLYPFHLLFKLAFFQKRKLPHFLSVLLCFTVCYLQFGFKDVIARHNLKEHHIVEERFTEIETALNYIETHPLGTNGFYLLKDNQTNMFCALQFLTNSKVNLYSEQSLYLMKKSDIPYEIITFKKN